MTNKYDSQTIEATRCRQMSDDALLYAMEFGDDLAANAAEFELERRTNPKGYFAIPSLRDIINGKGEYLR